MKQQEFIKAALTPDAPIPAGMVTPMGTPAKRRFDVYRNNIIVGLKEAIAASYPAVKSLVGDAFFDAMAGDYVRAHPPKTPILPLYGADFAAFIDNFAPASRLPYLGDVARLEYALRQSYHAADTRPVPAAEFSDPLLFTPPSRACAHSDLARKRLSRDQIAPLCPRRRPTVGRGGGCTDHTSRFRPRRHRLSARHLCRARCIAGRHGAGQCRRACALGSRSFAVSRHAFERRRHHRHSGGGSRCLTICSRQSWTGSTRWP